MRILLISSRYYPHVGGLETVVRELARRLSSAHEISIITNRYPRQLPELETIDGIAVTRYFFLYPRLSFLRTGNIGLFIASIILFPITLFRLGASIRYFKPDVVNVHYLGAVTPFIRILHKAMRFRLIVSLHGGDVDAEPHRSRFDLWLFRRSLLAADSITACSRYLLEQALQLVPEVSNKSHVTHNGIDTKLFVEAQPRAEETQYVFAVGQLAKHKGFDLLIDAFASLAGSYPQLRLLIAGDGKDRDSLQAKINSSGLGDRATLVGVFNQLEVAQAMSGSACVVIPSRREPFGIVAREAVASGRPVIVSRVGGLEEAVLGADVYFFETGNVDELILCLHKALKVEVRNCRNQEIAKQWDWSNVVDRYLGLICELR